MGVYAHTAGLLAGAVMKWLSPNRTTCLLVHVYTVAQSPVLSIILSPVCPSAHRLTLFTYHLIIEQALFTWFLFVVYTCRATKTFGNIVESVFWYRILIACFLRLLTLSLWPY